MTSLPLPARMTVNLHNVEAVELEQSSFNNERTEGTTYILSIKIKLKGSKHYTENVTMFSDEQITITNKED